MHLQLDFVLTDDFQGDAFIGPYHLIQATLEDGTVKAFLEEQNYRVPDVIEALKKRRQAKITQVEDAEFPFLAK